MLKMPDFLGNLEIGGAWVEDFCEIFVFVRDI